jgi:DNA mismatch repair protein MutL
VTIAVPAIRVLPPAVAARIAAGEVIERPASVVKELVENALDARAHRIRIAVEGGGLLLIRVADDGHGIPVDQLQLAVARHATSKLTDGDLSGVRTLGFRGEALPSIAAVADLTIVSAADDSGVGRRLAVAGGRIVHDEPAPHPRGTTVTVRHLFERLPARLAATARPQAELSHLGQVVRRLALAAPEVQFELVVEGRVALVTSGSGDLAATMVAVYGPAIAPSLAPLAAPSLPCGVVRGVAAGPEVTRPGRGQVTIVVNGRWVQPRGLLAALETAYRPLLPRGRHPILVVALDVPPHRLDINIHPAKLEVRLLDESPIATAVGDALRALLGRRPKLFDPTGFQFADDALLRGDADQSHQVHDGAVEWDAGRPIVTPGLPPLRLIGQVQQRLLLLEGPAGLYLLDQHRAHERILYERLRSRHGSSGTEALALPEPIVLELTPAQLHRFGHRLGDLAALGFDCEVFGARTFLVRSAPVLPGVTPTAAGSGLALDGLGNADGLAATLLALADGEAGEGEDWQERLLVSLSCRTAVRRGRPLARAAMRGLVQALGETSAPAVCPHGAPLLMHVSDALLERQFGWR